MIGSVLRAAVIVACWAATEAAAETAHERALFTPERAVAVRSFRSGEAPAVSPDGRLIAYTVVVPRAACDADDCTNSLARTELWISNVDTGASRLVAANASAPSWGPRGERLAFIAERGGHLRAHLYENGGVRELSGVDLAPVHQEQPLVWTPDGDALVGAFALRARVSPNEQDQLPVSTSLVEIWRSVLGAANDFIAADAERATLGLLRVTDGQMSALTESASIAEFVLSPDGGVLAIARVNGYQAGRTIFDVDILTIDSASRLSSARGFSTSRKRRLLMSWSPDSSYIAFVAAAEIGDSADDAFALSTQADVHLLTPGANPSLEQEFARPVWDSVSQSIFLTTSLASRGIGHEGVVDTLWRAWIDARPLEAAATFDGYTLLGLARAPLGSAEDALLVATQSDSSRQAALWRVNLVRGRAERVFQQRAAFHSNAGAAELGLTWSPTIGRLFFYFQSAHRPPDIWITDVRSSSLRPLTEINAELRGVRFATPQILQFRTEAGQLGYATLLVPTRRTRGRNRAPLIVWLYAGSFMSRQAFEFGLERGDGAGASLNAQLLTARGYAVLIPDTFLAMDTPREDVVRSVLPAVEIAGAEQGIDANRLGVFGHSYGAGAAIALIEETDRFDAAVAYAGITDLGAFYGQVGPIPWFTDQGRMSGSLWERPEAYQANSVFYFLNRIETPLLLAHGTADGVPVSQADIAFRALDALGREATLLRYAGEGHVFERPEVIIDFWGRVLDFYDEKLAPVD